VKDAAKFPEYDATYYGVFGLGANILMEYLSPICPLKPEIFNAASLNVEVKGRSYNAEAVICTDGETLTIGSIPITPPICKGLYVVISPEPNVLSCNV
jgi:hypothetical protein